LSKLAAYGIDIYRTDRAGDLTISIS